MKLLDRDGLSRFLNKIKTIIPTKTSDITNDSGYLDTAGVQNYMEEGGGYSQSYIDTALSGKADSSHTHTKSEITDFPTLATVATSGSYNDLSNTPTIPTVYNKTLTIQKNGTTVNTFTANSASDVTANITVPTAVSELTNDSGYLTSASSLDSSKLTGTIDIARLPKGALERLVTVANQTARFVLTTSDVQLGDTVKQLDTGVMYIVTDETKLSSADGYTEYTAGSATSVPWSGVSGKPSSFTPSSHTHGNVTNDGKLPTASRVLITDSSKNITVSSVSDTELGYLSGVTSAVQTQLNGKADDTRVVHKTGNETISGTKTFSNSTNVDLSIQKGISSGSCNIRFNDDTGLSRTVIRSYNDMLEIGHLRNANWYDGAEFILKDDGSSKIKSNNGTTSVEVSFNPDSVKPTNSVIDLGTSSNKWKSVYADSYYLGTAAFGDIATHNASEFSASNHVHGNITNDGKVGTAANKPLITGTGGVVQTGSFGTAANTFCEGNDSRLSDARTPLSHTHTKSDVTDLLNSNFIPSSDGSYNLGSSDLRWKQIWANGYKAKVSNIDFTDSTTTGSKQYWWIDTLEKNGSGFFGVGSVRTHSAGLNEEHFRIKNAEGNWADLYIQLSDDNQFTIGTSSHSDVTNNGFRGKFTPLDSFIPYVNNSYDLGSGSYQWNNLYAKNYFYNGTQWGLDRANTWTAQNSFNSDLNLNYASTDVDDIVNSVAGSATLDNFVHLTGNETVNGIKSFPDGVIANVTGSATSATNDGSGNVISTTYGKLGAANTWTGRQTYTDFAILYNSSKLPATKGQLPSENINPLRQYIGYGTNYDNAYFIHDTQINTDGLLFFRWTVFSIDHNDNAGMYLQIDPASQGFTRKLSVKASVLPHQTNAYNLGKSDLQWKSVYAQSYYYNGTPWGLDQRNSWTNDNCFKNPNYALGQTPTVTSGRYLLFTDYFNQNLGWVHHRISSTGVSSTEISAVNKFTNSQLDTNGTVQNATLKLGINSDASTFLQIAATDIVPWPGQTNENLGTSSNKWKSFNGVNPGLLSFPGTGDYTDIKGDITNLSGGDNTFTAPYDGWVCVKSTNATVIHIINTNWAVSQSATRSTAGTLCCLCPVMSGQSFRVIVNATSLEYAYIHPCKGNV